MNDNVFINFINIVFLQSSEFQYVKRKKKFLFQPISNIFSKSFICDVKMSFYGVINITFETALKKVSILTIYYDFYFIFLR